MQESTDFAAIPSGMDNDPKADEEVISQQPDDTTPASASQSDADELANKIAYALDGSGVGLPGSTPVVGNDPMIREK